MTPTLALFLCTSLSLLTLQAEERNLRPTNEAFDYVDQNNGIGNSCGPASLLNAFGSGHTNWQKAYLKIPGTSDRARIASVIKSWGQKPSATLTNRNRWEARGGVNFVDLAAMADDMRRLQWNLPKVKSQLFFSAAGSDSQHQLELAHKRLKKSFSKGLPPILSIRRFVLREGHCQSVHGHFVVLTALPEQLTKGQKEFPIQFLDPIGAKPYTASITLTEKAGFLPCLTINCPSSSIGKPQVKGSEVHALGLAGAIGAW